jgi:hypothetical protein
MFCALNVAMIRTVPERKGWSLLQLEQQSVGSAVG